MIKSKKQMYIIFFIIATVSALITWSVNNFLVYGVTDEMTGKFRTATSIIKRYSYNGVTDAELQEGSIKGLVDSLDDPYSAYLTAKEVADFERNFASEYVGLGISTTKIVNGFMIQKVAEHSPAAEAKIVENDIIVGVNDQKVKANEDTLSDMIYDTKPLTSLTILRDGKEVQVNIKESQVDFSQSISSVYEKNGKNVLVVDLQQFTDKTAQLLKEDLAILAEQHEIRMSQKQQEEKSVENEKADDKQLENKDELPMIDAIVFDLRNNIGGSVEDAERILDLLVSHEFAPIRIEKREPDEKTKKNQEKKSDENTPPEGEYKPKNNFSNTVEDSPLKVASVVLINEKTASSAEMVAQALSGGMPVEDIYMTLVGNTTAGKSTIQELKKMNDGSGIKLTTGKWYGFNNLDVEKTPISPKDEQDKMVDSYPYTVSALGASKEYKLGDSDKGSDETISTVQMTLNFFGYEIKRADGLFDNQTADALIRFQKDNKVNPSGKINLETLYVLNLRLNEYTKNKNNDATLQKGVDRVLEKEQEFKQYMMKEEETTNNQ